MSDPHADHNLLFGILALQMDFISRDALIAAMNRWVIEKSKPLGDLLVEQGALAADSQQILGALVGKHLEMHRGDPRQSLRALGSLGVVGEALGQLPDSDVRDTLAHLAVERFSDGAQETTLPPRPVTTSDEDRFEALRPHAWGGLGEVHVARDRELNREVALKRLHDRHAGSADSRVRFVQEAEITGGLEHPGIVPVYGLGTSSDGRPYYAMRFIRGETLKAAIERFHSDSPRSESRRRIDLRQLLTRFIAVCNTVEYAHSRGVVHRDLKPNNIMLGRYGETLVVDWGLAKALGSREADASHDEHTLIPSSGNSTSETLPGSAIGTPAYMSPEQSEGRIDEIGPASDVYSLGATLYSLLTGKDAFESSSVGVVLAKVQLGDFPPPRQRMASVPPPLEAICLKAMRLAPEDRYPSCAALAGDIEHWLADAPVSAYREPVTVRAFRWMRNHRALTTASAALTFAALVALIVGNALLSQANRQIAAEVDGKEHQRKLAEIKEAEAVRQSREATRQRDAATRQLYVSRMNLAQRAWDENNVGRASELLASLLPEQTGSVDLRGWEWHHLWRLTHTAARTLKFQCLALDFSPDGKMLAGGNDQGLVKIWDAAGSRELRSIQAHRFRIDRLAFSGDGRRLATQSSDGTAKIWETDTGLEVRAFRASNRLRSGLAISPDGQRLANSYLPELAVWDASSGKQLWKTRETGFTSALAFRPDGSALICAPWAGPIVEWNSENGHRKATWPQGTTSVNALAISADGRRLVTAHMGGSIDVWDLPAARQTKTFRPQTGSINSVAISRDGTRIAAIGNDTVLTISDAETGDEIQTLKGHASVGNAVRFSPAGHLIATGGWDESLRIWDAASRQDPWTLQLTDAVSSVAFSRDGSLLAAADGFSIVVWDASNCRRLWSERVAVTSGVTGTANAICFDPGSRRLFAALADGTIGLRDARTGRGARTFGRRPFDPMRALLSMAQAINGAPAQSVPQFPVTSLVVSPDGKLVGSGTIDGRVALWNAADGSLSKLLTGHINSVTSIAFSPDGRLLASAGEESRSGGPSDQRVRLWDVSTGQEVRQFVGHAGAVFCIAFSPDGRQIYTGSRDEMIRAWDVATGRTLRVHRGHSGDVHCLSMSPDGRRLASCSFDRTVKIWDVATGQEVSTFKSSAGSVLSVAFSPDGTRLAAGSVRGRVVLWDARPLTDELRLAINVNDLVERTALEASDEEDLLRRLRQLPEIDGPTRERALQAAVPHWRTAARKAKDRLEPLFRSIYLNEDVRTLIGSEGSLSELEWHIVNAMIAQRAEDAEALNGIARSVVFNPSLPREACANFLRFAQRARQLKPENLSYQVTVGAVQYRCGLFAEAAETLSQANRGLEKQPLGPDPVACGFLAMAHHKLGHEPLAAESLARGRELIKRSPWKDQAECVGALREAESLLNARRINAVGKTSGK